jgi:hypothetical protein
MVVVWQIPFYPRGLRIENFALQFFPLDNTFRLKKRVTIDAGQQRDQGIHGIKQSQSD